MQFPADKAAILQSVWTSCPQHRTQASGCIYLGNTMGDLETKIRQAGEELRSIRGHLHALKLNPTKRREEKAGALTFRSVRETGALTFRSVREKGRSIKRPELDTPKNQFTKFAELDHFVFSD